MGIVLLAMVFRARRRVANFGDTFRQSSLFSGIFLTLWTLQHVADFATLFQTTVRRLFTHGPHAR